MRDIEKDDNGEVILPVVYTRNNTYQPESVHKHEWGVLLNFGTYKRSFPWNRIVSVKEPIRNGSLPDWAEEA